MAKGPENSEDRTPPSEKVLQVIVSDLVPREVFTQGLDAILKKQGYQFDEATKFEILQRFVRAHVIEGLDKAEGAHLLSFTHSDDHPLDDPRGTAIGLLKAEFFRSNKR